MSRVSSIVLASLLLVAGIGAVVVPTASAEPTVTHLRIRSFDHVFLDATLFVPEGATANSTPFVLMTHGWAGSRVTTPTGRVGDLLDAGYGVLTWDSRGFGASGGQVELNSPDFEVKDVSAIITYLATNVPQAKLETAGDPLVGMSGGSYAGGIQLLAAAFDERIDVIAPEITWNDLVQSLAPNGVPKLGWTTALFGAGLATSCSAGAGIVPGGTVYTGCQTPELARYYAQVHATNSVSDEVRAALEHRSPKNYNQHVDIPTLLVQGFPDTLFDVNQAVANYEQIKANGAPVKLWLYDGGHALPGTSVPNTQAGLISSVVVAWMDRHLKGDTLVDTGPEVEYFVGGAWASAASWPPLAPRSSALGGIPALWQAPVMAGPPSAAVYPVAAGPLTLAGTAHIAFDVSGPVGFEGIVFVGLGVNTGGTITRLGPQVQPVRFVQSSGAENRVETDLVEVAGLVPEGSTLVIQFSSSEPMYDMSRTPAVTNVNDIHLDWHGA